MIIKTTTQKNNGKNAGKSYIQHITVDIDIIIILNYSKISEYDTEFSCFNKTIKTIFYKLKLKIEQI